MNSRPRRGSERLQKILLCSALLAALHVAYGDFTMTEIVSPSLGTIFSGASGRQFILNTDETVSGADAADYLFGAVSGELLLDHGKAKGKEKGKSKGNADVNIVAENITTTGGVTVNAVPCRFHKGAQTTCDGPGINVTLDKKKSLWVGVEISTSQVHSGGDTASITYDITVTFL